MATYDFNYAMTFLVNGGDVILITKTPTAGMLSDNEADESFEIGEPITSTVFSGGPFAGVISLGGQTFVVTGPDVVGFYNLYAGMDDPGGFDLGDAVFDPADIDRTDFVTCFAAGTGIATPGGERAVEDLAPGDPVLTADGRAVPVLFVGRRCVHRAFTPPERFAPVRIGAGALGPGVPHADLRVTADHGLILDGVIVPAGALVGVAGIVQEPARALPERLTYYHVVTEAHEVLLANGAPAESFTDSVTRGRFDNHGGYPGRAEPAWPIAEMSLPRVLTRGQVPPRILAGLPDRAA